MSYTIGTQNKTGSDRATRKLLIAFGWEAGIRTPIGGFRVRSPTVRRPPNKETQFTCCADELSNGRLSELHRLTFTRNFELGTLYLVLCTWYFVRFSAFTRFVAERSQHQLRAKYKVPSSKYNFLFTISHYQGTIGPAYLSCSQRQPYNSTSHVIRAQFAWGY